MRARNNNTNPCAVPLLIVPILVWVFMPTHAVAATYYVSQSSGRDEADGKSPATAWKTLARASREYDAGDSILLKRGDIWPNDTLAPKGSGTPENPITIASYGSGNRPILDGLDDHQKRIGIHLVDVQGYRIQGLEMTRYRTGIFAHYSADKEPKKFLWIEDCYIHDSTYYCAYYDYLKSMPSVGISLWTDETDPILVISDITVKNCRFERLTSALWTNNPDNWNKQADGIYNFGNLWIEDSITEEGKQWQLGLRGVDGGGVRRSVFHDTGRRFRAFNGVAGAMIQRCRDMVFEDSEWGFVSIGEPGMTSCDGQAFDFEVDALRMVMRNCLFHDTDGPGMMFCYGFSGPTPTRDVRLENCVFNGKAKRSEEAGLPKVAVWNTKQQNQARFENCRFYLSSGEELTNGGDLTFANCRIKRLGEACSTANLALKATATASSSLLASEPGKAIDGEINTSWIPADPNGAWLQVEFDEPRTVNEFMIREHPNSTITRYTIEYWDMQRKCWASCFNGLAIAGRAIVKDNQRSQMGFMAPIVARTTDKVRLVVNRTETGRCRIDEFEVYNDTTPGSLNAHGSPATAKLAAPATAKLAEGVFNDSDRQVVYVLDWKTFRSASELGGDEHYTNVKGASCQFTFTGTGVTWIGVKNLDNGEAEVYVDGNLEATVDTYSAKRLSQQELFKRTGLPQGEHTIKIVVKGTKNPASKDCYVVVDAFQVDGGG